jgi:hypothetical protein
VGPGGSGEVCWDMARSGGVWLGLAGSGTGLLGLVRSGGSGGPGEVCWDMAASGLVW